MAGLKIYSIHMRIRGYWKSGKMIFFKEKLYSACLIILFSSYGCASEGDMKFDNYQVEIMMGVDCDHETEQLDVILRFRNLGEEVVNFSRSELGLGVYPEDRFALFPEYPIGQKNYKKKARYRGGNGSHQISPMKSVFSLFPGEEIYIRNSISRLYELDTDFNYYVEAPVSYSVGPELKAVLVTVKSYIDMTCFSKNGIVWLKSEFD